MNRFVLVVAASVILSHMVSGIPAAANPPMLKAAKDAKDAGYPAQNCQYCHLSKTPKKEGWKLDDLNERGKWLATEKDKQKVPAVKIEWLGNYPGGKEQK